MAGILRGRGHVHARGVGRHVQGAALAVDVLGGVARPAGVGRRVGGLGEVALVVPVGVEEGIALPDLELVVVEAALDVVGADVGVVRDVLEIDGDGAAVEEVHRHGVDVRGVGGGVQVADRVDVGGPVLADLEDPGVVAHLALEAPARRALLVGHVGPAPGIRMADENRHPDINVLREVDDLMVLVRHAAPLGPLRPAPGPLRQKISHNKLLIQKPPPAPARRSPRVLFLFPPPAAPAGARRRTAPENFLKFGRYPPADPLILGTAGRLVNGTGAARPDARRFPPPAAVASCPAALPTEEARPCRKA